MKSKKSSPGNVYVISIRGGKSDMEGRSMINTENVSSRYSSINMNGTNSVNNKTG
jgi:hypothetical protein